jgi:RNA polymerase sigma-70 factor, ECF subfamily
MPIQSDEGDKARRFAETTIPHLDALYNFARYLTRSSRDAEDAVQECYLRAFRHFDGLHRTDMKPRLIAVLRNVCRAEYGRHQDLIREADTPDGNLLPLRQDEQEPPELMALRRQDADTVRSLVAALPTQFREVIVLREIEDLSYQHIATAIEAPLGTVMSRLARARSMLRAAWQRLESTDNDLGQLSHLKQAQ